MTFFGNGAAACGTAGPAAVVVQSNKISRPAQRQICPGVGDHRIRARRAGFQHIRLVSRAPSPAQTDLPEAGPDRWRHPAFVGPTLEIHCSFLAAMAEFRAEGRGGADDNSMIGSENREFGGTWATLVPGDAHPSRKPRSSGQTT